MSDTFACSSSKPGQLGPAVQRLGSDLHLHVLFRHFHRCGPRATALAFAELLDAIGADPVWLHHVLKWSCLDPDIIAALGGADFPRPPLDLVGRDTA